MPGFDSSQCYHYKLRKVLRVCYFPRVSSSAVWVCAIFFYPLVFAALEFPSLRLLCHLIVLTNLIALFCIVAISCILAVCAGSHSASAYSSIGRHKPKLVSARTEEHYLKCICLIHPRTFFALLIVTSLLNLRFHCIITPT